MDWKALVPHAVDDYALLPPTVSQAYRHVFPKAAGYAAAFVGAWLVILGSLRLLGFPETKGGARRGTWALKGAMLLHHASITPLALWALWEDPVTYGMYTCFGCPDFAQRMNRDRLPPVAARALTPVTLGYFLGDLLLLSQWSLTKSGAVENGLMLFHHVASLLVWPASIYFDWAARYVVVMLSYEFTSFWLTVIWMLSAADMKKSALYKLAGLVFTFAFVVQRMVGAIPQLLSMYYAPPWSQTSQEAAQPGGIHEHCWWVSTSLVAPHVLNLFWGVKVVRGFLAVLVGGKKKGEKKGE